jgi:hypothetical protein
MYFYFNYVSRRQIIELFKFHITVHLDTCSNKEINWFHIIVYVYFLYFIATLM